MKIFIIYASAGSGHKKVAESIFEQAKDRFVHDDIRLIDILDHTPKLFKFFYSKGYLFLVSRLPWLWEVFFYISDSPYLPLLNVCLRKWNNKMMCSGFIRFIAGEKPDIIISTHFLVSELVSVMKRLYLETVGLKLISMITDFGVHRFWLAAQVDTYCVASDETKKILLSKGVLESKVRVTGIPVRKQFLQSMSSADARERLGLPRDQFTVLILTGGIGMGPIFEIVRQLPSSISVLVVCGKNTKLKSRLEDLKRGNARIFGWIDNIDEIMRAADIVVTKPGGSTTYECLTLGLPMIFFSIIPGQEMHNARVLQGAHAGIVLSGVEAIVRKIQDYAQEPNTLEVQRQCIQAFRAPDPARAVLASCSFHAL